MDNETKAGALAGNTTAPDAAALDAMAGAALRAADAGFAPARSEAGQGIGPDFDAATPDKVRLDSAASERLSETAIDLLSAVVANVCGTYLAAVLPQAKADELANRLRALPEEKASIVNGAGHLLPMLPISPTTAGVSQLLLGLGAWGSRSAVVMSQAKALASLSKPQPKAAE